MSKLVVVRGGGDLGSGVIARLWRAGLQPVVLERPDPIAVRRTVAFAEAIWDGFARIEEIRAVHVDSPAAAVDAISRDLVPVLVDPAAATLDALKPVALVDAIMAKRNTGTRRDMAPLVVALGPGFSAGRDVDAVIETNRGPHLGRVLWLGAAEPDTGVPGRVAGHARARIIRAPADGIVETVASIGERIVTGDVVARVNGIEVRAEIDGVLRGLIRTGLRVSEGMKLGDVDPRGDPALCRLISDKALAIGGGALEAILADVAGRRP